MIIVLHPDVDAHADSIRAVVTMAERYREVTTRLHTYPGRTHTVTEVHLIGSTLQIPTEPFEALPGVLRVVRVSARYRLIGRHEAQIEPLRFEYNGVHFGDDELVLFPGLCAVDTLEHVDRMMKALAECRITTTRMGAYKPRTSPYDFQGLGAECLPFVFELAGKHGIRVIAMEVTHLRHIEEVQIALEEAGRPTGVMLQVGTRNAQNFELLRGIGQQGGFPVLFKRGMGITLEESFNACEYVAREGNPRIVFCLRGVKSHLGDPHRNLVDFGMVPVVRRMTRLPVCIDPSHSVGRPDLAPDGLPDIFHVTGQGLIAGASMVLVDFHPRPEQALCDGPQALTLDQLPQLVRYTSAVRDTYRRAVDEYAAGPPARARRATSDMSPPEQTGSAPSGGPPWSVA